MNIDLSRLINNFIDKIEINEIVNFNEDYIKNTDIKKLDSVKVSGLINKTEANIYNLYLSVSGIMILPCALTLEDVEYPFSLEIIEILSEAKEDDEKYFKINGNHIDIISIVWQNIILEIPSKVVSKSAHKINKIGDGWKLIIDDEEIDN